MTRRLSRRTLLRSAAATIALPLLEGMTPRRSAHAAERREDLHPTRLVYYFVPNGIVMPSFTPTGTGTDWVASTSTAALERHRDRVSVVTGSSNLAALSYELAPHTHATGAYLTDSPIEALPGAQVRGGTSIDQVVAQAIGYRTRLPSLQLGANTWGGLGHCEEGLGCAYLHTISWAGPTSPMPKLSDPVATFDYLFTGADPSATATDRARRAAQNASILDTVTHQANALQHRLGAADRQTLDAYLTGIRELERRLTLPAATCELPDAPKQPSGIEARLDAMSDLLVLALRCDQTRIATFMLDNGFADPVYDFLGLSRGHHETSHHFDDPDKIADLVVIDTWEVEWFARLMDKLAAVPEGDGTLLDSCMLVWGSSISEGNFHDPRNLPLVLGGSGGGRLRMGEHIVLPEDTALARLHLTMIQQMGVHRTSFGIGGEAPLDELLA